MISKKEVQHVAKLGRIGLKDKEIEKMQKELAVILDYIALLKEVDISNIEPTSHPNAIENVMREDEIKEQDPETILNLVALAPSKKEGYIKVKSIL